MKLKLIIISLCILFIPTIINAAEQDPKAKAESFLTSLQEGNIAEAYDQLFIGSNIPVSKPQAVEMLKMQTTSGLGLYGDILKFGKLREEKFGKSVIRLVYILESELAPTFWEFYFYKPNDDWFLVNIKFNDQFNLLDPKK